MCGEICQKNCCHDHHHVHDGCFRFFIAVKFMICVLIFGSMLGFVGLYVIDRDKFMKEKAKKMFKNVENFTQGVQKKFQPHNQ